MSDLVDITVADLTQDDTVEAMAKRVLATAPDQFVLAGLSMGGYLAQEVMRQAPNRISKLALLDTSFYADTPEQSERRRGLIELSQKGAFKGVTSRLLPLLIHDSRLEDDDLTQTIFKMAESVGKDAYLRQQHVIMTRPDGSDDLAKIMCPTLVLCGREDALTPLRVHEKMAERIPNAHLVVVEDCGHLAPLERPRT
ncbi:MAG: alpha/beta fold hydrolase, partial [Rhodospirillales bacterium]